MNYNPILMLGCLVFVALLCSIMFCNYCINYFRSHLGFCCFKAINSISKFNFISQTKTPHRLQCLCDSIFQKQRGPDSNEKRSFSVLNRGLFWSVVRHDMCILRLLQRAQVVVPTRQGKDHCLA